MEYNIYCDESCHIEHDGNNLMVLGGIKCELSKVKEINEQILSLKEDHRFKRQAEVKWTKISPNNVSLYNDLIDLYFDNQDLSFRGYIAFGKNDLNHKAYKQDYNDWYYKMYYRTIEYIIDQDRSSSYNIYLDIKDTIGSKKVKVLHDYFNSHYGNGVVNKIQLIKSHEVGILQLTDIFIGALSYKNRALLTSSAKLGLIKKIEDRAGHMMDCAIPSEETRTNWFIWTPSHWR